MIIKKYKNQNCHLMFYNLCFHVHSTMESQRSLTRNLYKHLRYLKLSVLILHSLSIPHKLGHTLKHPVAVFSHKHIGNSKQNHWWKCSTQLTGSNIYSKSSIFQQYSPILPCQIWSSQIQFLNISFSLTILINYCHGLHRMIFNAVPSYTELKIKNSPLDFITLFDRFASLFIKWNKHKWTPL